jgi:hypothetical protein
LTTIGCLIVTSGADVVVVVVDVGVVDVGGVVDVVVVGVVVVVVVGVAVVVVTGAGGVVVTTGAGCWGFGCATGTRRGACVTTTVSATTGCV